MNMATKPPKAPYDGKTSLRDPEQELFCVLWTSNQTPRYFGHGQHSYAFAYGHQKRIDEIVALIKGPAKDRKKKSIKELEAEIKRIEATCRSCSTKLLIKADIKARCNFLMDQLAAHVIVDRELLYVIEQRHDLPSKVQAIRHHDQREARVREKVDVKHEFEPIKGFTYVTPEPATPAKKK